MSLTSFSVFRTGVIDGIKTTQELPVQSLMWSDASRWMPAEERTSRLYVVECTNEDSDGETFTYHYVCRLVCGEFYDYTRQKSVEVSQWTRVRWAAI